MTDVTDDKLVEGPGLINVPPPAPTGFVGVVTDEPQPRRPDDAVDEQSRINAHEALDRWLDRCGEVPVRMDNGEWHSIMFEAAIVTRSSADDTAIWCITVERREREDL